MKTLLLLGMLLGHTLSPSLQNELQTQGSFYAVVNGKNFQVREDQLYRGLLINRSGSMDGRTPERKMINVVFSSPTEQNADSKLVADNIQFELSYNPDRTGAPESYVVSMQYESRNYYLLKEQSKLTISEFRWDEDKKHFTISADFHCKMRSFGYPSDGMKDIDLKGAMKHIRITVPSWLADKG